MNITSTVINIIMAISSGRDLDTRRVHDVRLDTNSHNSLNIAPIELKISATDRYDKNTLKIMVKSAKIR